ncbi:plasmid mobilization relaxosome protein MobC, partial [Pseudomonas aeruginosa]|uniref:plasmid mobilization relaxosome protein MobC n=1 Tax=Pseudomonas aeruginosa TaxID=287 RepID=UPI001E64D1D7
MLTIRVTDDEHARLLERCEGKQLAVWMRRVCLGGPVAPFGKMPAPGPPFLRQPGAPGKKPNQKARKEERGEGSSRYRVPGGGTLIALRGCVRR